jgi:hypothetical protein
VRVEAKKSELAIGIQEILTLGPERYGRGGDDLDDDIPF